MINVSDLKPGITFQQNGDIFVVISSYHSKQARSQALIKTKVKNLRTGSTLLKTFTNRDKIEKANIEKKKVIFLYLDKNYIFLMEEENSEELKVPIKNFQWEKFFLSNKSSITVKKFGKEVLQIINPASVELEVVDAYDAVKGNTHNNAYKKVKIETGFELEVPIFIKAKDIIIVASKDGKYLGKVNQ